MHKFFGYVIEKDGNVSQFFPSRTKAIAACQHEGIPEDCIVMLYRYEKLLPLEKEKDENLQTGASSESNVDSFSSSID